MWCDRDATAPLRHQAAESKDGMDKSDTTCVTKESGTLVPIRTILPPSVRVAANPNADRSSTWTQARTPQRYAENLVDLAAFQVWLRQDNPFEDLPVQIELTCGTATLPIGDQMLQVGTIRVLLRLAFVEASIKPGTQYEMEAPGYQARSEQSDTGSSTRSAGRDRFSASIVLTHRPV